MARTLVAGFGNVLRGDDGFGVEVVRRLEASGAFGDEVRFMEVGTGGIRLAQELLAGYQRLIVVDAMLRGGAAGTVYVRRVEAVEAAEEVDLHLAVPSRALSVAQALGALPEVVYLVGCEPVETEELTTELSAPVRAGVEEAIRRIRALVTPSPLDREAVHP